MENIKTRLKGILKHHDDLSDAEMATILRTIEILEKERWIPVEEKLPGDNQVVLVSVDRCFPNPIEFAYRDNDKWVFARDNNIDFDSTDITVFAWRPLPKIYKYWNDDDEEACININDDTHIVGVDAISHVR